MVKSSSLFEKDSRVLPLFANSAAPKDSPASCLELSIPGPTITATVYSILASSQPSWVWIRASPLLCCVGPLISTPD